MGKRLEDLTKQEWDTLFPIELEAHHPNWKLLFDTEKQRIIDALGDRIVGVEHVGSTSIPGICAKPYIDICIEISSDDLFDEALIDALCRLDYHYFRQSGHSSDYMIFVKGYDVNGPKDEIYHIHMCPTGHEMLLQIVFRDYLRKHPDCALEYEQLKKHLAITYKHDCVGYRVAKSDFIAKIISLAMP